MCNKFIIGFIVGCILTTTTAFAFRMAKPTKLVFPLDESQISRLNKDLESLWNITTGRYSLEVVTSIPTSTDANEGELKAYYSGSTRRLYIFINSAWRYINTDG